MAQIFASIEYNIYRESRYVDFAFIKIAFKDVDISITTACNHDSILAILTVCRTGTLANRAEYSDEMSHGAVC